MYKKQGSFGFPTCQDLAQAIVNNLTHEENDAIEKVELKQVGTGNPAISGFFLNITLKNSFIENQINSLLLAGEVKVNTDALEAEEAKMGKKI